MILFLIPTFEELDCGFLPKHVFAPGMVMIESAWNPTQIASWGEVFEITWEQCFPMQAHISLQQSGI